MSVIPAHQTLFFVNLFFSQTLPLQPAAWETTGCLWPAPGRTSEGRRPPSAPSPSLASLSQSVPLSPIPGTRATGTTTKGRSTSPSATWAAGASPGAPPTAATKASPGSSPSSRPPGFCPPTGAHPIQRARRGPDGGCEATRAPSLTRVSVQSSGAVS